MPPDAVKALLDAAMAELRSAGCQNPGLDARLLLEHATGLSHADILREPSRPVAAGEALAFRALVRRRAAHEPVSRILGAREFYGRSFALTPDVLDPRPDTETLVDAALALMPTGCHVLDLGAGSGAIAITLLAERPQARAVAVDVSPAALGVARLNAQALGVADRLTLLEGSWFDPVEGRFDLIVSNPPYVEEKEFRGLPPDVRNFDPALALLGGDDGLACYRAIADGAAGHISPGGQVLVEIGAGQETGVTAVFRARRWSRTIRRQDLGGHVRCLGFVTTA